MVYVDVNDICGHVERYGKPSHRRKKKITLYPRSKKAKNSQQCNQPSKIAMTCSFLYATVEQENQSVVYTSQVRVLETKRKNDSIQLKKL